MPEHFWLAVEWLLAQDFFIDRKVDLLARLGEQSSQEA